MSRGRAVANKVEMPSSEWALVGHGLFTPSMGSVATLPPGCYTPFYTGNEWVLKASVMTHDVIHDLGDDTQVGVLRELNAFLKRREAYERYGLVYKRGILMHGKPGTGKTVILSQIADKVTALGGYTIQADSMQLARMMLNKIKGVHPVSLVVVILEDIDRFCDDDDDESELLEMLDGNTQHDGVVYIATTNNIESIPARVRQRPSRFDAVVEVLPPTEHARAVYLGKLADGDLTAEDLSEIVRKTDGMVMAQLKEIFILHKVYGHPVQDAVARVKAMCEE